MSVFEDWQAGNDAYLEAALNWLRLKLTQLAEAVEKKTATTGGKNWFQSPIATQTTSRADIDRAAQQMTAAAQISPPPALVMLSQQFRLSAFEQAVLLLCAAMELDTSIAGLCAQAQGHSPSPYPTFALALSCFEQPTWDVVSPERPLRYWRLLEVNQSGVQALTNSPLRADERIVNYIKGLNYLDDRLMPFLMPLEVTHTSAELPPSQQAAIQAAIQAIETASAWNSSPVIQLIGADSFSQQLIAQEVATALDLTLYRLPASLLPTQANELETLARLWHRENLLLPIALYLDAHDTINTDSTTLPLQRFLARSGGLFFLSTREMSQGTAQVIQTIDIDKPTTAEQRSLWIERLGEDTIKTADLLSSQFNLNPVAIDRIAKTARQTADSHQSLQDKLWQTCLDQTRPQLDALAQRLNPKATWETLVLSAEEADLLHQIVEQVRHRTTVYQDWGFEQRMNRGMGISALFAGESGTGKTMAAEVIANALRLNLYRIDLSAVVSKYIGETEKNLRRLFDAAEAGGAILFFDEADALFGKRSEVKDSHDRYANIEINYLLQRMESYRGLAILATNLKNALDHAFMRRLRFIVNFPFPGIKERQIIWQKAFPATTPVEELDFNRLAKLNLTGGSIHNIALNAAFLAAQTGSPIAMSHILTAARTEFRKLDRPINEADFR